MTDFDIPLLYLYRMWLMRGGRRGYEFRTTAQLYERTGNPLYYNMHTFMILDMLILRWGFTDMISTPKN